VLSLLSCCRAVVRSLSGPDPPGELCVRCGQPATFRGLLQTVSMWGSVLRCWREAPLGTPEVSPHRTALGRGGGWHLPSQLAECLIPLGSLSLASRRLTTTRHAPTLPNPTAPFLRPRGHVARLNPHGTLLLGTRCCWISIDIEDVGGRGLGRCPPGEARPVPSIRELASTHAARSH
jgi:hypothetical protein